MGINDEYSRDAFTYELAYDSDENDETPDPLHPEDWQDWYSEQLIDAWMTIRQYSEENYIYMKTGFHKFVEFVMEPEDFYDANQPSLDVMNIWNAIKNIDVIREHVTIENFNHWAIINIGYL
jgi:hypothetical protein